MGMYRECPQKYKFRYVHKLQEKPKYYFAFGQSMHKAMEYVYGVDKPPFPTAKQTLEFFERDWNATTYQEKGYASMAKELEGYAEGRRIITEFYKKYESSFFVPLSVEMRSTLDIDNLSLISIIDRVDYLGGGKIAILDYKTGKTVQREPDQLFMYQKVAEASPAIKKLVQAKDPGVQEIKVEKMTFFHLPTLKEMDFERAGEAEINVFWAGVLKTADDIRAGIYTPDPGETKCRFCDFKEFCPVFTGVEFGQEKKAPPAPAPKGDLSEKIDNYGALIMQSKNLKTQILKEMEAQNYNQHFGKDFKAELREKETFDFPDRQAVVDYLKAKNLLAKTLVPTESTILALLDNPDIKEEDKDGLRKLLKPKTAKDILFTKVDD